MPEDHKQAPQKREELKKFAASSNRAFSNDFVVGAAWYGRRPDIKVYIQRNQRWEYRCEARDVMFTENNYRAFRVTIEECVSRFLFWVQPLNCFLYQNNLQITFAFNTHHHGAATTPQEEALQECKSGL
jgi:hypothetical protein